MSCSEMLRLVRCLIPPLGYNLHKGQCGRIGVVGGSLEYTGAPYYAAISALKTGADLAFVFCEETAAIPIKAYSPELIVQPSLIRSTSINPPPASDIAKRVIDWFPRLQALVVGPGLGRDPLVLESVALVIESAKTFDLPLIIDGDGLYLISQRPSLVYGFKKAILTPNAVEFARLSNGQDIQSLARQFGGVTIIQKSQVDLISNGECLVEGTLIASPRRCGGQGDVLAGSLATFACWAFRKDAPSFDCYSPSVVACYGATYLLRNCAIRAFDKYHRSTTTVEMISEIGRVFYETFEEQPKL